MSLIRIFLDENILSSIPVSKSIQGSLVSDIFNFYIDWAQKKKRSITVVNARGFTDFVASQGYRKFKTSDGNIGFIGLYIGGIKTIDVNEDDLLPEEVVTKKNDLLGCFPNIAFPFSRSI